MILFTAENYQLNLTNINITFIEESSFFFDSFYKNYTPPFFLPADDETALKLGLINVDNVSSYTVKHAGSLLIDFDLFDAFFLIEVENKNIECTLYFGKLSLPFLEKKLSDFTWPTIKATNLVSYINNSLSKSWPDVPCNFPMVIDNFTKEERDYDAFLGFANNYTGGSFVFNSLVEGVALNKNIMVPYLYIMEILKTCFASSGVSVIGDFTQNKANNYLLLDPKKHLSSFSTALEEVYILSEPTSQYIANDVLISEYIKEHTISAKGVYSLKVAFNLPKTETVKVFKILENDVVIYETDELNVNKEFTFSKEETAGTITVKILLELESTGLDISDYNNFHFDKTDGKVNIFKKTFSLSEVMPDITFGGFLSFLKNWFNLRITYKNDYVIIDYVEENFYQLDFIDETAFEVPQPKRSFSQEKVYKLKYNNDELIIGKKGITDNLDGVRQEDVFEIDMEVHLLPIKEKDDIITAERDEDVDFGILLYKGLNTDGLPAATSFVEENTTFSLREVYDLYWRKWVYFRTNSEEYTDEFTAHLLDSFSLDKGRFKYNKKHINKSISKMRISEEFYKYTIVSETL
jgi:hypothetical protein